MTAAVDWRATHPTPPPEPEKLFDELLGLGGAGTLTTLSYSAGFSYLNNSRELTRNLDFTKTVAAKEIPDSLIARWEARREDYLFFGWVLVVFGTVVAAVALRFVPNCSAPMVTNIAQKPLPKPIKPQTV